MEALMLFGYIRLFKILTRRQHLVILVYNIYDPNIGGISAGFDCHWAVFALDMRSLWIVDLLCSVVSNCYTALRVVD